MVLISLERIRCSATKPVGIAHRTTSFLGSSGFAHGQIVPSVQILPPFQILTLQEAVDLARVLLRFLIDFQKFMVMSTVDYPIESAVITKRAGVQPVDVMRIDPMPTRQSYGSGNMTNPP